MMAVSMAPKEHVERFFRAIVQDYSAAAVGPSGTGLFLCPASGVGHELVAAHPRRWAALGHRRLVVGVDRSEQRRDRAQLHPAHRQPRALKGISDVRAAAIVKGRPYARKDELVPKGIVPQLVYDEIREQIVARQ